MGDADLFAVELLAPGIVLVAVAWLLPTFVARRMPETFRALFVNLVFSAAALWGLAALGFAVSYAAQGIPLAVLTSGFSHFVYLGALSGLLWGPIVLLALAMEPQKWRPDL
ncbi:MAG: hypothetical protein AAF618_13960 [Pseudomonadota bacterium]